MQQLEFKLDEGGVMRAVGHDDVSIIYWPASPASPFECCVGDHRRYLERLRDAVAWCSEMVSDRAQFLRKVE